MNLGLKIGCRSFHRLAETKICPTSTTTRRKTQSNRVQVVVITVWQHVAQDPFLRAKQKQTKAPSYFRLAGAFQKTPGTKKHLSCLYRLPKSLGGKTNAPRRLPHVCFLALTPDLRKAPLELNPNATPTLNHNAFLTASALFKNDKQHTWI